MDNSKNLLAHEGDGQQLIENFPVSFFSHAEAIFHLKEAGIETETIQNMGINDIKELLDEHIKFVDDKKTDPFISINKVRC